MLFYRASAPARPISLRAVRGFSLAALLAYPVGAFTVNFGGHSPTSLIVGYGFVLMSLLCFAALVNSSLQRIVAETPDKLDEYEMQLRSRAMNLSYTLFTAIVLAGVIYAAIASDHGGWLPVTYEQYNGLFWGVFLYAMILPVACLGWLVDASFEDAR